MPEKERKEDQFRYEYLDRRVEEAQAERRSKRQLEREKKLASKKSPEERARIARRHRFFWVGVLICVALIFFAARTVDTLTTLQEQKDNVQKQLDALTKQKDQLEIELREVQSEEYVEQEARSELRMIYPGEVLFVAPEDEEEKDTEDSGTGADQDSSKDGKDQN
jgi:cell division protein DivIC